ncbi:hypothetical protein SODALDRAFT_364438 [Sodiomyces alkalinus F11]|uniref:PLD phosphodiesterase domain-containing protein n=1 Tax=Sodiomyces alkalinus (strain CBS 110278 / VKM F-3762 / F11) TaxID=1314773 RepID=A0A3N2PIY7_SODAK|nr:hypothetical protein SODALDRAFT_364438 [Sodiomyces alkalinus F11]ROT34507.1 hypothetical protein SODALDRAFT_364438 [Sodiomyces alkalinus F11]
MRRQWRHLAFSGDEWLVLRLMLCSHAHRSIAMKQTNPHRNSLPPSHLPPGMGSTSTSTSDLPRPFLHTWVQSLKSRRKEQLDYFPSYHVSDPECLVATCQPQSITVGSGAYIYKHTILPALLAARHEIILVTCFWAPSESLQAIQDALAGLVDRRRAAIEAPNNDPDSIPPLRIRIRFSSRSFFQKLFHTWSPAGHVYPPSAWPGLGLPADEVLRAARIELSVKTLFFLPFSVMHPKFVVIDRQRAWMPSCNVSWETWFEGCLEFTGPAVGKLLRFYGHVWEWGNYEDWLKESTVWDNRVAAQVPPKSNNAVGVVGPIPNGSNPACRTLALNMPPTPAIILPSSHHRNPGFRFIPFLRRTCPPATPLNMALLTLFATARKQIDILTPNLTSRAVVDALLSALARGVHVRIRTSRNMMLLEQLATAFTTTERTLQSLIQRYTAAVAHWEEAARRASDIEAQDQDPRPGRLEVYYYRPDAAAQAAGEKEEEPVVSHLKMTLVDKEFLVLGSGNMDRASWHTSQELGILLYVPRFEHDVWAEVLETRMEVRFVGGPDQEM